MNEARPEIRQLIAEATAKYWTDAQIDTAWAHAIRETGLLGGVATQKRAHILTAANADSFFYPLPNGTVDLRAVLVRSRAQSPPHWAIITDEPSAIPNLEVGRGVQYVYFHDTTLSVYPTSSVVETLMVYYVQHPLIPTAAGTATDLPKQLLRAPVWLAASFLVNQDYKHDVAEKYYERAMDLIAAYRRRFITEVPVAK